MTRQTGKQRGKTRTCKRRRKQFNGLNIQVYGTYEEPLFKAKAIGELLGIEKIRKPISKTVHYLKTIVQVIYEQRKYK